MNVLAIGAVVLAAVLATGCTQTLTPQQQEAVELRKFCDQGQNMMSDKCASFRNIP